MDKGKAIALGKAAIGHLELTDPDSLEWARAISPATFKNLRFRKFLEQYCWVVYASGFSYEKLKPFFPRLTVAFKSFDAEALSRMRSIKPALEVFANERKAACFLKGAKAIEREGFSSFKRRLRKGGSDTLTELPGIANITKHHLARNIGLDDTAKPDIWLERAASQCDTDVASLSTFLAEHLGETRGTIDVAIWSLGKDKKLKY